MAKVVTRTLASAAAVALGASLFSTVAFAAAIPLGNLNPENAASFSENVTTSVVDVEATFELTTEALTSISATIPVARSFMYKPGELELFKTEDATPLAEVPLVFSPGRYQADLELVLGALASGDVYTIVVTGTNAIAPGTLGVEGGVLTTAVPEPSTWALMVLGFMGLGYAGFRRGARGRAPAVAI